MTLILSRTTSANVITSGNILILQAGRLISSIGDLTLSGGDFTDADGVLIGGYQLAV